MENLSEGPRGKRKGGATNFMSGDQQGTKGRTPRRDAPRVRRDSRRGSITPLGRGHQGEGEVGEWRTTMSLVLRLQLPEV